MQKVTGGNSSQKGTQAITKGRHAKRVSRVVFTLNNWTPVELEDIKTIPAKWMIIAKERGEEGTDHLQGAIIFGTQKTFSQLHKLPGLARAHFEEMLGTPQQSIVYCSKEDPAPYIAGDLPQQGKRSDLAETVEGLRKGKTIKEIVQDNPGAIAFVRYSKGLNSLRSIYAKKRSPLFPPKVFWFYGPTGTCKTRTAFHLSSLLGNREVWITSGSVKWFDGYDEQSTALFDDLRTKDVQFSYLLRLLDRYPIQVEIKGGHVNWVPDYIFVTAPDHPRTMWSLRTDEQLDQLCRRITQTVEFPICRQHWDELFELLGIEGGRDLFEEFYPKQIPSRHNPSSGSELDISNEELYSNILSNPTLQQPTLQATQTFSQAKCSALTNTGGFNILDWSSVSETDSFEGNDSEGDQRQKRFF